MIVYKIQFNFCPTPEGGVFGEYEVGSDGVESIALMNGAAFVHFENGTMQSFHNLNRVFHRNK